MATTFAFDADDPRDYAGMKERQALMQSLMSRPRSSPRNVGEGISSAARDIANAFMMRQQLTEGREGRAGAKGQFQGLMSDFEGAPATPGTEPAVAPGTAPGLDAPGAPAPDLQMGAEPGTPAREPGLGVLSDPKIWEFLANPYGDPNQQQFVLEQINQQIQTAQPQTPKEKLELDLLQAQIEKTRAAAVPKGRTQMLSGEQAQQMGLPAGNYQQGPQGKVSTIGKGGITTNISNVGSIPKGYELFRDPETKATRMQPIPGGPAALEATAAAEAKTAAAGMKQQTADIVTEDIDRVLAALDTPGELAKTGFVGGIASTLPGTGAFDMRALIDTIKANVGFDKLQAMRAASPTGGALGQVSERENLLLQSTLGNMDQSQSEEQFRQNLSRVKKIYLDIVHGPGNRPGASEGGWQDMGGGIRIRRKN